jgi:NADH-quinone oxidoreductase subunit N
MLAYSSIAHSAYVLIPMVAMYFTQSAAILGDGVSIGSAEKAVVYYALAYTIMTLLAFGVAITLREEGEGPISDYAGLYHRRPAIAVFLALGLFSLLGIPPTVGFLGKYLLFAVAIEAGQFYLAVVLILASVASAYYYLNMIVTMFMKEPAEVPAGTAGTGGAAAIPRVDFWLLAFSAFCIFYFFFHQSAYLIGG